MVDRSLLERLAQRYVWWKTPDEALAYPHRVVAQVMDLGTYDDLTLLAAHLGAAVLRDVLVHAEAGQFSAPSWSYWHYRLGLARLDEVPPMPVRQFR
jgi:hypothetical protein